MCFFRPLPSAFCLLLSAVALLCLNGVGGPAWAVETQSSPVMTKTQLVVKLATQETIPVRPRFEANPPIIVIEFPPGRVGAALPERSVIQEGVVQEIRVAYVHAAKAARRWIKAVRIHLRGPYEYQVFSEPGRIVVEIEHPAAVAGTPAKAGLAKGVVVSGPASPAFSERFQAMEDAMMRASHQPVMWGINFEDASAPQSSEPIPDAASSGSASESSTPSGATQRRAGEDTRRSLWWLWTLAAVGLGLWVGATRWARRGQGDTAPRLRGAGQTMYNLSGIRVIDQLVWRAFERQGYQLLQTVELGEPPGLMRVIAREGFKTALLCVGDGAFFEKAAVERFLKSMQQVSVGQGYLVAPGSFTVPAQRFAKEHKVTLIGRDQLTELLSAGAMSEHYNRQLQQGHRQLEEAKETLSQYAKQLDVLRRQRNEASWFLGEERAKTAKLEEQFAEASQQITHWQAQAQQWQQTAEAAQKRWEESEWYLGETRASARHLEELLRSTQEALSQLEQQHGELTATFQATERQRDDANWYLGESRAACAALKQQVQELEAARVTLQSLEAERAAVRAFGERRKARRAVRPDIMVEVQGTDGAMLFNGTPRDLSRTGFGLSAEQPIELPESFRVRFSLPGMGRPIESLARVVWQQQDPRTQRHQRGCEFVDSPPETRDALEYAIAAV